MRYQGIQTQRDQRLIEELRPDIERHWSANRRTGPGVVLLVTTGHIDQVRGFLTWCSQAELFRLGLLLPLEHSDAFWAYIAETAIEQALIVRIGSGAVAVYRLQSNAAAHTLTV